MRLHTTKRTSAREICRSVENAPIIAVPHGDIAVSIGSANLWHGVQFQCDLTTQTSPSGCPTSQSTSRGKDVSFIERHHLAETLGFHQCRAGRLRSIRRGHNTYTAPQHVSAGFNRSVGLSGLPVSSDNTDSPSVIGMGSYPLGDWSPERPGKHAIIGVRPMPRSEPRHGRRIFNRALSGRRNEHSGGGHKKMDRTRFSATRAAERRREVPIPFQVGTQ